MLLQVKYYVIKNIQYSIKNKGKNKVKELMEYRWKKNSSELVAAGV